MSKKRCPALDVEEVLREASDAGVTLAVDVVGELSIEPASKRDFWGALLEPHKRAIVGHLATSFL